MILDNETRLTTATAFDLNVEKPGAGNPICLFASGVGGSLVVTTGATSGAATDACITVDATNDVEFALPSNTQQFIRATFAQGTVEVVLDSQTNN